MEIEQLKRIPIVDLLSHLGHAPVSRIRGGRQWLYHSPLRGDANASFSVSLDRNLWYDFGIDRGGTIIDLAIALNGNCSFHQAVLWLEEQTRAIGFGNGILPSESRKAYLTRDKESEMSNVRVEPLTRKALVDYLWSRGIPIDIGRNYCKEVHYTVRGKEFYGLCFMNILGGMEIRNPFFKGGYGVKAPSIITIEKERHTPSCCVFEGFMDFLSYQAMKSRKCLTVVQAVPCDCIVLNSTSMVRKAIPFIDVYESAYCYLDNDSAGRQSFESIRNAIADKAVSMSSTFQEYNDLNDYYQSLLTRPR